MKIHGSILALALLAAGCTNEPEFDATGSFESANEITVSSEAAGIIRQLDIEEGDFLKAGLPIGYIDTTQLHLSKLQLRATAASVRINRPDIELQIAAIREQIAKQEHELQRVQRLFADGAATQKQIDDIQSSLQVLNSRLEANISTLRKNTGSLDSQGSSIDIQIAQLDDRIRKSIISPAVSGTVTACYMKAGEYATPGRPLFKIANLDNMVLCAYFTSSQLADIKLGQEVTVFADFGDNQRFEYPGRIIWISPDNEFTPKNIQTADSRASLVYAVKIAVRNDGKIKIGTFGEVVL